MAGFLAHLWRVARQRLRDERRLHRFQSRLVDARIERPFYLKGNAANIRVGRGVLVFRNSVFHGGGLAWSQGKGSIVIGDNCWFGEGVLLYGAGGIEIGHTTGLGPGTKVFSSRDDYALEHARLDHIVHCFGKVTIGPYARIFSDVVVGPGVTIGEGAVVGAGSVVLDDVPPWTVAAGTPARVIRPRGRDERAEALGRESGAGPPGSGAKSSGGRWGQP